MFNHIIKHISKNIKYAHHDYPINNIKLNKIYAQSTNNIGIINYSFHKNPIKNMSLISHNNVHKYNSNMNYTIHKSTNNLISNTTEYVQAQQPKNIIIFHNIRTNDAVSFNVKVAVCYEICDTNNKKTEIVDNLNKYLSNDIRNYVLSHTFLEFEKNFSILSTTINYSEFLEYSQKNGYRMTHIEFVEYFKDVKIQPKMDAIDSGCIPLHYAIVCGGICFGIIYVTLATIIK
jgi:hypothetical protein